MYIYAHINKNTLRFVREQKAISFDYVTRITKFKEDKLTLWESNDSGKFPTINQAKTIAKCYRIPFAGLYMNAQDINIKHLPKMRNLRSLPNAIVDNSALNLAIADVLSARELLLESKKALKETVVQVICRRLLDTGKITQQRYSQLTTAIRLQFESERKAAQEYRKITGQVIPQNMSREAIDQNSSALCRTFFHGYREGLFDKQDISRYLGVKQNHVDKFIWEVSKW